MRYLPLSFLALAAILGFDIPAFSQNQPVDEPARPPWPAGAPAPRGDSDGPWNHRILLATSDDGLAWTVGGEVLVERASVPELFAGPDGLPILLFVDASGAAARGALGAMVQQADGSWARRDTNLRGADPNIVRLKDGSYRGYTKERDGAIIVFSSPDGLRWERIGEAFRDERYRNSTDSDVFETPDGWVALISLGPQLLRCTSPDGLKFTAGEFMELGGSVSDTVKVDGGWRTFFHVNATPQNGGRMRIRSAFTADGKTWKVEEGDRVVAPASGSASLGVADPAPVQLKDGSWLMAVKSFIEPAHTGPQFTGRTDFQQRPDSQGVGRESRPVPQGERRGEGDRRGQVFRPSPGGPGGGSTPREHQVHSATSKDGLAWTRDDGVRLMSASVPCAINDGDKRVLLYVVRPPDESGGVGGVSCAVSTDGTNFNIESGFRIEGLSTLTAADPCAVQDADGKFRLYYLASDHRGDPARGANPHKINLALSDDGIRFRETGTAFEFNDLVDPDVFRFNGQWFMYVFGKGGTLIATSADGKGFNYSRVMSPPNWGTTAPLTLPDGRLRLYAFEQRVPIGNAVGSFISTDGLNWTAETGPRLKANADEQITDPFVIPWRGGFKMYFKHSPARTRNVAANGPQDFGGQNNQRPDNQTGGRDVPPLPRGEARGEGERRAPTSQAPNDFTPKPPPRDFNADGPWNRDVIVHHVSRAGAVEKLATFEGGGAPTIARLKDGRLVVAHQHFPQDGRVNHDQMTVLFSGDEGKTWTAPAVIRVDGLPEGMPFAFDPTLVPLPDGRVRLYFTGNLRPPSGRGTPAIYSAISADGVNYSYEPGVRFDVEGRIIIDCAAVLHQGVFHLFVPDNGTGLNPSQRPANEPAANRPREGIGYHATSKDGLSFTRVDDVQIEGRRRWLGNAQSDGKLITFYGTGEGMSSSTAGDGRPRGAFWMAASEDGKNWKLAANPPIGGGDPGAVKTRDGGLLVVITGESRLRASGVRADFRPQQNFDNAGGPPGGALDRTPPRDSATAGGPGGRNRAEKIESKYKVAPTIKPGRFVTGQDADIMLGGFGFNNSGGAGILNHPTGLASDGKRLLVADRWNNRVQVWNTLPSKNSPPDLVLGQRDFNTNTPGSGRNELNWPGNVAIAPDGTRLAVADTDNSRVLLWNSFPKSNAAPAEISISLREMDNQGRKMRFGWPWGVWTDGTRLAVVATHGAAVLIWNTWPQRDDQAPDFVLRPRNSGTPRNITSDGTIFLLSDHNYGERSRPATMVWNSWPQREDQEPDFVWSEWFKGCITPHKQLVLGGLGAMHVFNKLPRTGDDLPDITLQPQGYRNGDGPDCVFAGGRLYVCNYNGNNVLAWNGVPRHATEPPAFALGTDDPGVNMWDTHFFIQNPVVSTNGESLFVSSDFDRKMFVWRKLPDENIAKPDVVFQLADGPWDNALHGQTLVLGGKDVLTIWRKLPLQGEPPDLVLRRRIGSVELREVTGVALDEKFLYVADRQANRVYVWEGIPDERTEPKFTLEVSNPARMNSDGTWLTVAPFEGQEITFFRVADLPGGQPEGWLGGNGMFNLPGDACVSHGMLFVADRSFNRVHVWHNVQDALDSRPADAWLGARDASDRESGIARNKLSMPGSVAFDGTYLWVGEQKFSTRILRFSPRAGVAAPPAP